MPTKPKTQKIQPVQRPKGMHDILPHEQPIWEKIKKNARDIAEFYNFSPIEIPLLERMELFERSVGEGTDVIEKQMFTIVAKGNEKLALRPEATAGIARAFIENGMSQLGSPLKLYLEGPMFRYEQPQAGRYREFHQLNFEILSNESDPIYDAQLMLVFTRLLESLKIKNITIKVNSIGCKNCRPGYRRKLQTYYKQKKSQLCKDCLRRLETNPLRLLDCKEEQCAPLKADAPIIVDELCTSCRNHFKSVLDYLEELKLPYALDHRLVRGLDYYSRTVFEIVVEGYGQALGGGGRYDYLVELLGGKNVPAVGFAAGMERIIDVIRLQEINLGLREKPKIFLIYIGDLAKKRSLLLIEEMRRNHIDVAESLGKESLNAQLRVADKLGSPLALIFGQKEAFEESIIIRDLKTGAQETIPLAKLAESVKKKLKEVDA
ncbi:MAG: histidine--tRNA ligase [Patescibacteria group bacterium]